MENKNWSEFCLKLKQRMKMNEKDEMEESEGWLT